MELLLILLVLGVVIAIYVAIKAANVNAAKEDLRVKQLAADDFLTKLAETKTLPEITVSIVLKRGETGVLQEQSKLFETRAQRLYAGAGTRIGRIYLGGGASESVQRLREIDSGTLVLTNQRLVFDGGSQNRATNLADILSASTWQDAIEVSSARRQKSQVYSVANPMIWASLIQNLASGNFSVAPQVKAG